VPVALDKTAKPRGMSVVSRLILVQVPIDAADKCAGTVAIAATEIIAEQGLPLRNPLRLGLLSLQREFRDGLWRPHGARGDHEATCNDKCTHRLMRKRKSHESRLPLFERWPSPHHAQQESLATSLAKL
jgi:hypothetical protein